MKLYKVRHCWECPDNVDGVCWDDKFDPNGRTITFDDREQIRSHKFPDWCPLEDVK